MKSRMYQFYELRDGIKQAIAVSEKTEMEQKRLVAALITAGVADQFKEFVKGITDGWVSMENERAGLNSRLKLCEQIIAMHEARDDKSELVNEIVTLTLEALGATRPQRKNDKTDA